MYCNCTLCTILIIITSQDYEMHQEIRKYIKNGEINTRYIFIESFIEI